MTGKTHHKNHLKLGKAKQSGLKGKRKALFLVLVVLSKLGLRLLSHLFEMIKH